MTVRFLKKHLEYRPGDEAELSDDMAKYMIRMGVVQDASYDEEEDENVLMQHLQSTQTRTTRKYTRKKKSV